MCLWGTAHGTHIEKKAQATQRGVSKGKVFPEEAAHGPPLYKAPVSPIHSAVMQSAMGLSPVIPIQERWGTGTKVTGTKKDSRDDEAVERLSSRRRDAWLLKPRMKWDKEG